MGCGLLNGAIRIIVCACAAGAADPPLTDDPLVDDPSGGRAPPLSSIRSPTAVAPSGEKVWTLTNYLKGTPAQIRDKLQKPVDEFVEKTAEARKRVAQRKRDIERAHAEALAKARRRSVYARTAKRLQDAEVALAAARKAGTAQEKLDAGSTYNKLRKQVEEMETDAVLRDKELATHMTLQVEDAQSLQRCEESLKKIRAWRDRLIDAIAATAEMRGPLDVGTEGTLGEVTVVEAVGADGLIVEYLAPVAQEQTGEADGIVQLNQSVIRERVLVPAGGGSNVRPGDHITLHHNFQVVGTRPSATGDGRTIVVKRQQSDVDKLLEAILPLKDK